MRLFTFTYAAACSRGYATVLMTEEDLLIEIGRLIVLKKFKSAKTLKAFLETAVIGSQSEPLSDNLFICVNCDYKQELGQRIRYNNLNDATARPYLDHALRDDNS